MHIFSQERQRRSKPRATGSPSSILLRFPFWLQTGVLQRTYAVLTPDGVLAEGEYADPQDIPDTLPDRFEHYFRTAEADIVPVFRMKR